MTEFKLRGAKTVFCGTGAASGTDIAQDLAGVAASVTVSLRTERWIMHRGKAVQVEPMKPMLKAPKSQCLKPTRG
jgi:cation diffusion facilitator CzcD-associated flavoprotein CzcO